MLKKKFLSCISIVLAICMALAVPAYASQKDKHKGKGNEKHSSFVIEEGIFKGNGKGDYFWNDYVKRADIVVMVVRAFKLSAILGDNFPDVEENSYYYDAIRTAKSMGIAKGDGKRFHPKQWVTVGQAIMLIERAVSVANSNVHVDTSVDLNDLYGDSDLSDYATRDDIAYMLYIILAGDSESEETYDLDTIEYTTNEDAEIKFDSDDFAAELEDLDYVNFTLPAYTYGKLYYDYESSSDYESIVKATTKYYSDPDDGPDLSKVTFVPYSNYTGTVTVVYTAYDVDDTSFTGTVEIEVVEKDDDLNTIEYTTKEDTEVQFDSDDFTAKLEDLDYVKFNLPVYTYGKLYYDYESSTDYGSIVKATTKYYANPDDGSDLSKVTFVPYWNYSGAVTIEFTAYDEDGNSYTGIVEIDVSEALDKITWTTGENDAVAFDEEDFSDVLDDVTDKDLNYVKFILPEYKEGKLYYDFESSSDYGSLVKATTKYYLDPDNGPDISEITFLPYTDYTGTVSIKYTAFDESGTSYNGTIEISVEED